MTQKSVTLDDLAAKVEAGFDRLTNKLAVIEHGMTKGFDDLGEMILGITNRLDILDQRAKIEQLEKDVAYIKERLAIK